MKVILIFLINLLGGGLLCAQEVYPQLDAYLRREVGRFSIPDLNLLIVSKDSVVFARSMGTAAADSSTYYLGSVSKSLTAFGILKLIERGQVHFDSKVVDLLPELDFTHSANEITVRHLLTHTSGIRRRDGFGELPSAAELRTTGHTIDNEPVTPLRHEYSNLNYSLLGLIIERVTGRPFGDYMQAEVFGPLMMQDAHIGSREELAPRLIPHYQYLGPFPVERQQLDFSPASIPSGFIGASARDLGNFLMMNLAAGAFRGEQLLDSALIQTMHTPWDGHDYGYAMGWKQGWYNDHQLYQHLGSTANSYAGIFLIPAKGIGVVLLTNSNSLSFTESLAAGVIQLLTDGQPQPPSAWEWWLRMGVLLILAFVLLNFCYRLVVLFRNRPPIDRQKALKELLMNAILLVLLVLFFPTFADIPFLTFLRIQPDIGGLLLVALLLPVLLNGSRLLLAR